MLNWLSENYQLCILILGVMISIINVVVSAIRRKVNVKMVDSSLSSVIQKLPEFIVKAESTCCDGKTKFAYVLTQAINELSMITDLDSKVITQKYSDVISENIENILSTPQKKEDK